MLSLLVGWMFIVIGCSLLHPGVGFIVLGLAWLSGAIKWGK